MSPMRRDPEAWSVFLPLKPFLAGKTRLNLLPDDVRIALIKAMASDVVDSIMELANIEAVTVVGVSHEEVSSLKDPRLRSYLPKVISGINSDVLLAVGGSRKIAVILPDLPAVTSAEIAIALDLAEGNRQSFIRDAEGSGSSMYFAPSRQYFSPQFGVNSAHSHALNAAVELSHPTFLGIRRDCDDLVGLTNIPISTLGLATRSFVNHMVQR